MRLYNTLTRTEEVFEPRADNTVRMYTCGLTVYARGHIGNFRTFICVDVLRRALKYLLGYRVRQVVNFTDVDDRTILGAQKAGMDLRAYTDQYIAMFKDDARALGLEEVEERPRATDEANLRAMAGLIQSLTKNGHTYVSDGSIYFKISTMPEYGKLARLDHDGMKPGARIDTDNYAKEDARDFVLWKAAKPGEPSWDLVEPAGRPGWHLECSAMALRLLGESPIDLHAGGIDLIFPHHENEIAQSEGATGKLFSRFWMHVEYLIVDEQKMSKSLGNTYTIPDVVAKGFRPSAVRLLLLSAHYRKQLNFTWDSLAAAEESLRRMLDCLVRVEAVVREGAHAEIAARVEEARAAFSAAVQDDLNTAAALGAIFELVRALNSAVDAGQIGRGDVSVVRDAFDEFDRVLGVLSLRRAEDAQPPVPMDEIEKRIEDRHAARRRRDFAAADRIRDELAAHGVLLEDGPGGTRWKRK
ncbi:MAG TPA: cysteine--tRNA ligase [Vicinamibacterales bacterium]|jgi:cysteinyl-tRNA synthetase|nr:cysteine--tRNA ligase [Vicinamibacterales bacterium]